MSERIMPEIVEQLLDEYQELAKRDSVQAPDSPGVNWDDYVSRTIDMAGSLAPMLAAEILRRALAEQTLLPALAVLKRLRQVSYALQSVWIGSDSLLTAYTTHRAGDSAAVVQELESGRDDLDSFGLYLLAHNYESLKKTTSALQCYSDALAICDEPKLKFTILYEMARHHFNIQQWHESEQAYVSAADVIRAEAKTRHNVEYYALCVFYRGYASQRRMLASGDPDALIGTDIYDGSVLQSVQFWLDYLGGDDSPEDFVGSGLFPLWMAAGDAAAFADHMAQAAEDASPPSTKLPKPAEEPEPQPVMAQMGSLMERLDRLCAYEDGGQPYAEAMLSRFPGLSEQASWHLGFAEYLWKSEPKGCPLQSVLSPLALALEIVLRQGLLESMFRHAASNAACLDPGGSVPPNYWLGVKGGRRMTPDRINLGMVAPFFTPPIADSMIEFIECKCPNELRAWLLQDAHQEMRELAQARNAAAHGAPIGRELIADVRTLVFDRGLLQRLIALGPDASAL